MYFDLFLICFLSGCLGSWVVMKFGFHIGIIDRSNHRSSHSGGIPKGGGAGVLVSLIASCLVLKIPHYFWVPALLISLISFWGGDKHRLSAKQRLVIQFVCSLFFAINVFYSKQFSFSEYYLIVPISVFIVGTSNFYNFMDGIDGIAGITGVIGFSLLSYYGNISGVNGIYTDLCIAIVCSCIGFLCFNIPRAKVFIGDVGSILLGFLFACMVVTLSDSLLSFIVMTGFLAPFYFDELFTIVLRIRNRESLLIAHRKHIYQVLTNEARISHLKIALSYGLVQLLIGLSIISLRHKGIIFLLMLYLIYTLMFTVISIIIRRKYPLNES